MRDKKTQSKVLSVEDRVLSEVRTLETWYSAEFERRLTELAAVLNSQLEAKVEQVRAQYQQQYQALQQQASELRQAQPTTPTKRNLPKELLEELGRAEISIQKCAADLERMVSDDSIPMGRLLQLRSQELELKAYIRGLKFNATGGGEPFQPAEPPK